MRALGVGVDKILETIQQRKPGIPGRQISHRPGGHHGPGRGRIDEPQRSASIIVAQRGGAPVDLDQVASIEDGAQEMTTGPWSTGKPALSIDIVKVRGIQYHRGGRRRTRGGGRTAQHTAARCQTQVVRDSSTGIRNSVADVKAT